MSPNIFNISSSAVISLKVKVDQSCPTLYDPKSIEFSRPEYWNGQPFPSPGDLPNPGIEPRSPTLQEDSLPAKPQGKPKNAGVGSLSLLQWIFPTQEGSPALQADSLPVEPQGKPKVMIRYDINCIRCRGKPSWLMST